MSRRFNTPLKDQTSERFSSTKKRLRDLGRQLSGSASEPEPEPQTPLINKDKEGLPQDSFPKQSDDESQQNAGKAPALGRRLFGALKKSSSLGPKQGRGKGRPGLLDNDEIADAGSDDSDSEGDGGSGEGEGTRGKRRSTIGSGKGQILEMKLLPIDQIEDALDERVSFLGIYTALNGIVLVICILCVEVLCVWMGMCNYPQNNPAVPEYGDALLPIIVSVAFGLCPLGYLSIRTTSLFWLFINTWAQLGIALLLIVYSSISFHRRDESDLRSSVSRNWDGYSIHVHNYYETVDELVYQKMDNYLMIGIAGFIGGVLILCLFMISFVKFCLVFHEFLK